DAADISLFLERRDAPGLAVTPQTRIDHRGAGLVRLDGVAVAREDLVGPLAGGGALLEQVVDRATAGLCAEMLGGMTQIFEDTLRYLMERVQFGVPIGSFQAFKHRAARVFM